MSTLIMGMSSQIYNHFEEHKHDVWEIIINLQGSGYMTIDGMQYEYKPGSIFCIPSNSEHTKHSEEGFKDMYLLTTTFVLSKYTVDNKPLIFQDDEDKSIETLFQIIYKAFHRKEHNYSTVVNTLFEAISQLLLSMIYTVQIDKDVEQLKNQLTDSFSDPDFSVSELLQESVYSADHMRRRFKKAVGKTPQEYLTKLRIDYACRLIRENHTLHYSIAEIGAMSGYYDSHYFSRIFKKSMGMTPIEYLKK